MESRSVLMHSLMRIHFEGAFFGAGVARQDTDRLEPDSPLFISHHTGAGDDRVPPGVAPRQSHHSRFIPCTSYNVIVKQFG